jgi:hypothetical protein
MLLKDPESGSPADVLYESVTTIVSRISHLSGSIVFKQAVGHDARPRLQHEKAMLERLVVRPLKQIHIKSPLDQTCSSGIPQARH